MTLSNKLIYEGKVKCGSESVAKQSLFLPGSETWNKLHDAEGNGCKVKREDGSSQSCWINDLLLER